MRVPCTFFELEKVRQNDHWQGCPLLRVGRNLPHVLVHHWVFKGTDLWRVKDRGKDANARLKSVGNMLSGCARHRLLMSKLVCDFAKSRNGVAILVTRVYTLAMKTVSNESENVEFINKGARQAQTPHYECLSQGKETLA